MVTRFTLFIISIICCGALGIQAQATFFDDFESYEVGEYLGPQSDIWRTWSNGGEGGSEDVRIVDDNANSGDNSIYFKGSGGGGPADVILPFGQAYNSGFFIFKQMMYISENKESYFNFQGNQTIGQVWVMNATFNRDGTYAITDGENTPVFDGTYPQEEWFEFAFNINLDANIWNFVLNGECVGSFTNPVNRLASMDLYPIDGNAEFWIDDVSFEHIEEAPEINLDGGISIAGVNFLGLIGTEVQSIGNLINNGSDIITSATIEISYSGETTNLEFPDINLEPGQSQELMLETPISLTEGNSNIGITIVELNGAAEDDEACNNQIVAIGRAITPALGRAVLVEEGTGTWCGWCPRGAVAMERFGEKYGDYFVGVAVHNGDPMVVNAYDNEVSSQVEGYPNAFVDRTQISDPSLAENPFLDKISQAPIATFEVGSVATDDSREMEFIIKVTAIEDLQSERLFVALVEDHVTGTGANWGQSNYFAGGGEGPMGGYEDLPATVPASQMVYEDVARALLTSYAGDIEFLQEELLAGDSRTFSYSFDVPEDFDIENMSIVAALHKGGETANAIQVTLPDAVANGDLSTGINDPLLQSNFAISPNPAADLVNIKLELAELEDVKLEVYNIYGTLVKTFIKNNFVGQQNWILNISDLTNGTYMVRVNVGRKSAIHKLQKLSN